MASNAPTPLHPVDPEALADAEDERIAAFDNAEDGEHAHMAPTSTPAQRRAFRLVEATPPVSTLLYGSAAVLLGGVAGYWLGARRAPQQPARKAKHVVSNVENAVELLPVAMQLLSNPVVRSLAIRLLMRRLAG